MMPFISEELYQKLPEYQGKCKTITKSPYPEPFTSKHAGAREHFKEIETQFEVVNKFAGTLRSIAAGVNLPPHIKPEAFIIT
jgi:valyl-tRNA synthetase